MPGLSVASRREEELGFLDLRGEARLEEIPHLRGAARGLLEGGAKSLLVGTSKLEFVDSASIGAFLELDGECRTRGGTLVVYGPSPRLRRVIADTGLDGRFRVAADEAAARVAAGQPSARPEPPPAKKRR
jgi:anti-anti-sigma factor